MCVQSKVSNNVSGRMCLAIEIYLHYYSVLTMRLGSSIPPVPYFSPTAYQSPRTVFDLRSRSLDLWVARQLVKPCLRQHGQACTQRQHLSRWLLSRSSSLCALRSSLPSSVCSAVQSSFGLGSSVTCRNCFQASATKIRFEQPEHLQNVNLQQRINSSVK